jgi:hypothetical protein
MCSKSVNESERRFRFISLTEEPRRILQPIEGYENMPLVSLEAALHPVTSIVPEVEQMVWTVKQNQFEGEHGLTDDESASIMLYTMEWEPRDNSLYTILNKTLRESDRNLLRPWYLYLRLIMTSLTKIPLDSQQLTVYRGSVLDLRAQYPKGASIIWWGFTSCTRSIDILTDERFLWQTGIRTLFTIECHSGKSIKQYSFDPDEEEVLLPPACQFQVMGCHNLDDGLNIIRLKEIRPPFPLMAVVPQFSNVSLLLKQQSTSSSSIQQTPKVFLASQCDNPKLQESIDDMHSDRVIVSL